MSNTLRESLIQLNDTINKDEGIVNTSSAHRFLNKPQEIEDQYVEYARTHLVQPDIDRFLGALTGSLSDPDNDRSVPGYIVGPYGYGKTSTAGKVWYTLENENNYIATPPIYFKDLQAIIDAVYGWMRHRLTGREDYLEELEESYEAKATNNVDDLVSQTGLDNKDDVKNELEDLIEAGAIDIEFSVNSVLEFLSECNQIARDAGFDGLVVIADELQQFVSNHNSDKEAYSELRDIAKSIALGLNEGDGLGLLFTMDDGLHSDLDVNADDVLARLSEQNVKLNLSSVYNRQFPSNLWDSLSKKYDFHDERHEIISEDALDAIGQICERGPPLSNGPRTVVDILTIGIQHWLDDDTPYDALDLANSYYQGTVRYKGEKIKAAITEAVNADVINSTERENFIKLCGVFPRGVSDELLEKYGVYTAKEDVKGTLHGQLIITHEEGRTLKSLEREGEDRGIKDELFTQFYRKYDTTDIYNENASQIFRDVVLKEELFPAKRGKTLNSWITDQDFAPETQQVYTAVFSGSFNGQQYPKRILEIRTGHTGETVANATSGRDFDLSFGFVHHMEKRETVNPSIEQSDRDEVVFHLNFLDSFDSLPSNIALLEDYMSPEDVNPHLLLSLYKFIGNWTEQKTINPNEEEQLQYIRDQLITQSVQKLFGPPINGDDFLSEEGSDRRTTQPTQVVQKAFNIVIEDVYQDYTTLFISDNYKTFLDDYESLLYGNEPDLLISQKRGNKPIEGTKTDIANALGVSSNSTAKTRLDKQFSSLAEVEVWSGTDARIRLTLHPLEEHLKEAIEEADDEQLTISEAYEVGSKTGHRTEEVDWALRLLDAREYIIRHEEEEYVELSDIAIDRGDVLKRYENIKEKADSLAGFESTWDDEKEVMEKLNEVEEALEDAGEEDIELLDQALGTLTTVENLISTRASAVQATYRERCRNKKQALSSKATKKPPRDMKSDVQDAKVPFEMHLDDVRVTLENEFKSIKQDAEDAKDELQGKIDAADGAEPLRAIEKLQNGLEEAKTAESDLDERFEEVEEKAADYSAWCDLAQDMGEIRSEMVRYKDSHDDPGQAKVLLEQLDDQLGEIQEAFQRDTQQTLRDAGVHRESFTDIETEFKQITEGDRDVFTFRKRVLENTIREATKGHATIRHTLDPNDPQQSRSNLHHEFTSQLKEEDGGFDDIRERIERVRGTLGYAELLNQVPDDPEHTPESIETGLEEVEQHIASVEQAVSEMDVKDDIPLPEADEREEDFPQTSKTLQLIVEDEPVDIASRIVAQRELVDSYESEIKKWRKTTEEPSEGLQYLMNEIEYGQGTDIETILTNVAEKNDGSLDIDNVFDDLQELFEGNHIQITVKSEHR
ncbi:hypothetical protein [Halorubrum sp. SD683]|uniref:hypothetical protein n=1 Tax=Halorubrum sp. SD683 TaxID=1855873 RepID=UPI00117A072A|nr:hypothetical protein [Halorubrum sp. SD683]